MTTIQSLLILNSKKEPILGHQSISPHLKTTSVRFNSNYLAAVHDPSADHLSIIAILNQYIEKIREHIKDEIDVRNKYFEILQILLSDEKVKETRMVSPTLNISLWPSIREVYVDINERCTAVLSKNLDIFSSSLIGSIFCKNGFNTDVKIDGAVQWIDKKVPIGDKRCLISRYYTEIEPVVQLHRNKSGANSIIYELKTRRNVEMTIKIPIDSTSFNIKTKASTGTAILKEQNNIDSVVFWNTKKGGTLELDISYIKNCESANQPIIIDFEGNTAVTDTRVTSVMRGGMKVKDAFVRYEISGRYEIR